MPLIKTAAAISIVAGILVAGGGKRSGAALNLPPAQNPPQSGVVAVPVPAAPAVEARFVVVLDAAHGGSDTGARVDDKVLEKDVTLAFALRLRSMLRARGIPVVTTRDADVNVEEVNRAETANHAQAAACLVIHATATGSGVHLFTSSLSPVAPSRFEPWQTAQAPYEQQSVKLESEIDAALAHTQVPVTLSRASVQPMDNLTCPAVAVEIAPLVGGHVTAAKPVADAGYQTSIINALAAALEQWRSDWKQS